jgi:hypothetical protein
MPGSGFHLAWQHGSRVVSQAAIVFGFVFRHAKTKPVPVRFVTAGEEHDRAPGISRMAPYRVHV